MQNLFTQGKLYVFIILFVYAGFSNELSSQNRGDDPDPQRENLLRLSESFYQQYLLQQERLERLATEEGIQLRQESEWGIIEIVEVNERGFFQAEMTNNLNAAITVGTNELWTGGSTSLDLMGDEYLLGIWDGGGARATHQEFNNGGFGARVTIMDGASLSNHATHVAGTPAEYKTVLKVWRHKRYCVVRMIGEMICLKWLPKLL